MAHKKTTRVKYLFIYPDRDSPQSEINVLINQLYEALVSPVSCIDQIHAGPDMRRAIRITYRADGPDPDDDANTA